MHNINISTLQKEAREDFAEVAELTENPIEDNGMWVDGGFYRIYKGNAERFLDTLIQKVVDACENSVVESVKEHDEFGEREHAIKGAFTNFRK